MINRNGGLITCVVLIFSFTFSACSIGKMPEIAHSDDPLWDIELEGANPEFVEDYIYLWDLLENEYPMLSAAERITGKDAQEIKERYYKRITSFALPEDFYMYVIAPCLSEFR